MRRAWPDAALPLALYAALCAFVVWHVETLQDPRLTAGDLVPIVALALVPALAARTFGGRSWWIALVPVLVVGVGESAGIWPHPRHPLGYLDRVFTELHDGIRGWLNVTLPYSRTREPDIRTVVLLTTLVVLLAAAHGLLVRYRPLLVIGVALAPFATASIVYELDRPLLRGLLFLAFALVLLALGDGLERFSDRRRPQHAVVLGAIVVAFAAITASLPGVARGSLLPWRDWNLSTASSSVGVRYVWNQTYSGLRWPSKRTEVLRVQSPQRAYWRAIVLPEFDGYRWTQGAYQPVGDAMGGTWLDTNRTEQAPNQPTTKVSFTVEGLAEPYLLSAGQPVRYELPLEPGPAQIDPDGVVRTTNIPERGTTYSVVTKLTDPKPGDLRDAGTSYPPSVTREGLAAFPDMPVPAFGTPNREALMDQRFAFSSANPKHDGWKKVYESVRTALGKQPLQTPYDTVIALETYFRTHYAYDEHVVLSDADGPPLPGWIENGTAGYCQMFSGSMAELLRLLGIPARVAEGFTNGTFDQKSRVWRVTDHDAHAWVEVYFPGYGWLPFDPTPSRSLGTQSSTSSARFALSKTGVVRSADKIGADLDRPAAGEPSRQSLHRHGEGSGSGANETLPAPVRQHGPSLVLDLLAVLAGALALLLLLKQALRLVRLRADDPRSRAVAYRADLAAYARDQRVDLGDELTHEELGRRLKTQFGVEPTAWVKAADGARYAPEPAAADAAQVLRGETRRLRREMARSLSVRERAAGAVSLRSVVRQ